MLFKIVRDVDVYAPDHLGRRDILIAGDKVARIASKIDVPVSLGDVDEFSLSGRKVVPGYIDYHNHFLGGGGGTGFASRVPPMHLTQFTRAGITTVVGCLGMDGTTRNMPALLGLAHSLDLEGLTTYIYSGATFEHPAVTLTGRVRTDMIYVDKIIGVGEVSLSENGPSLATYGPGTAYIAQVASEAMMAGRLTGKCGVVVLQVPTVRQGLKPLFEILERTGIPARQFVPAHANSNEEYLQQVIRFAELGGTIDLTSTYSPEAAHPRSIKSSKAVTRILESGIPIDQITMTTDGNGAYPLLQEGRSHYLSVSTLHQEVRDMVIDEALDLSDALKVVTANPARILHLEKKKGCVAEGADADFLVLDDDLNIDYVFAKGRPMVVEGEPVVRGMWEHLLAS